MSLFRFLLPPTPLGWLPHLQLLIYVRLLTQKKAPAMELQSPVHSVLSSLSSPTLCSGTLQSLALVFPFLLARAGLLRCLCLHLAQFLLQHLAHCLHLVGSQYQGFPGGASGKEHACNAGDVMRHGLDPWVGKRPWRRAGNPLQYSCMETPMDRGAQGATDHRVEKSWT